MATDPKPVEFRDGVPFLGGALWIDFLNTTPVIAGEVLDLIPDAQQLQRWQRLAELDPGIAAQPNTAHKLRDHLRAAFTALLRGGPLPRAIVDPINALLLHLKISRQLQPSGAGYKVVEDLSDECRTLETVIALDFASFVSAMEPERLKHCDNPACTMVFYDRSKNNRRRWCSTAVCGNRDKVANYRARKATPQT